MICPHCHKKIEISDYDKKEEKKTQDIVHDIAQQKTKRLLKKKNQKRKKEIIEKLKKFKLDKKKINMILDLVKKTNLIELDYADINAILGQGKKIIIESGEPSKVFKNLKKIKDKKKANTALISAIVNEKISLDQVKKIIEKICEKLKKDAYIIWAAGFRKGIKKIKLTVLLVK